MLIYSLKSWNGRFFEHVTLKSLNCRIQLGHPIGDPCLLKYPASGDSFVVIDTSGVHEVGLDYCGCKAGVDEATQLLRFRLYPATVHSPTLQRLFDVFIISSCLTLNRNVQLMSTFRLLYVNQTILASRISKFVYPVTDKHTCTAAYATDRGVTLLFRWSFDATLRRRVVGRNLL